jgi:mono/diheme cytochrome c family protein
MKTLTTWTGLLALAGTLPVLAAEVDASKLPPASDRKGVTYAQDIKPIFDKSCIRCHGPEKPKAGLRMDSLAGLLKGTSERKVIKPGDSAQSLLVHAVAQLGDEEHWMPPPGNKAGIAPLTKEQVGLIRAWVDQGAK